MDWVSMASGVAGGLAKGLAGAPSSAFAEGMNRQDGSGWNVNFGQQATDKQNDWMLWAVVGLAALWIMKKK